MKTVLKFIIIFLSILNCNIVQSQSFNCDHISWTNVKDTIGLNGDPAVEISLFTNENTFQTGYTSFWLINETNDTIVKWPLYSGWMPVIEGLGDPVRKYIFDLNPPFTSVNSQMNLTLHSDSPTCEFQIDLITQTDVVLSENIDFKVSPSHFKSDLNLRFNEIPNSICEIYDLRGVMHYSNSIRTKEISINTSNWSKGIYIVMVKGKAEIVIKI